MKVALTCCILSLAFLAIFSAESAGEKESLQIFRNKKSLSQKAVNIRKLRKGKGRKESRQSNTCDKDQAFIDYKKAVEYMKKIDKVVKFVKELEKKSTFKSPYSPFKNYAELLGAATDNGTTCTQEAKEAYKFLQSCSQTIPTLCAPLEINIKEAENCTNNQ